MAADVILFCRNIPEAFLTLGRREAEQMAVTDQAVAARTVEALRRAGKRVVYLRTN